jgi:uncharacterized membrane protein YccC
LEPWIVLAVLLVLGLGYNQTKSKLAWGKVGVPLVLIIGLFVVGFAALSPNWLKEGVAALIALGILVVFFRQHKAG